MSPTAQRPHFGWGVLLLVLLAAGIRFYIMERSYPVELLGDEVYYAQVAENIAQGKGHYHPGTRSSAWRPPLNAFLFAQVADPKLALTPQMLLRYTRPFLIVQVLLGSLLVGVTAWLAYQLFGELAAWLAGLIATVYPAFIAHSHFLWSEMLFSVLVSTALCLVVGCRDRPRVWVAALAGLCFGVAVLTREIAAAVAAVSALWWVAEAPGVERGRALLRSALMISCMLLVVAPWSYRNYRALGRVVPVSTVGWFAAAEGNTLGHPVWLASIGREGFGFRRQYFAIPDEVERMDFARSWLAERVTAEQPTWIFKKFVRGIAQLFSPESYLFYKLARGSYGMVALPLVRGLMVFALLLYLVLIPLAVLGIASARSGGRRALICGIIGVIVCVHVLSNSGVRFRVPWMPLLIGCASFAALDLRASLRQLSRREWLACAVVLLLFFGVCVPFYFDGAAALWSQGSSAVAR